MSKVPKSTPHSDLDGVHRDRRPVIETALENDEDAGDLERARQDSPGRPDNSDDK